MSFIQQHRRSGGSGHIGRTVNHTTGFISATRDGKTLVITPLKADIERLGWLEHTKLSFGFDEGTQYSRFIKDESGYELRVRHNKHEGRETSWAWLIHVPINRPDTIIATARPVGVRYPLICKIDDGALVFRLPTGFELQRNAGASVRRIA